MLILFTSTNIHRIEKLFLVLARNYAVRGSDIARWTKLFVFLASVFIHQQVFFQDIVFIEYLKYFIMTHKFFLSFYEFLSFL